MNTLKKGLVRKLAACSIICLLLCVLAFAGLSYVDAMLFNTPEPSNNDTDPSVTEPAEPTEKGLQGSSTVYLSTVTDGGGIQGLGSTTPGYSWNILHYDSGKFHMLVIDSDGFVYSRGSNQHEQLGLEGGHNSSASNYYSTSNYYTYFQPVAALNHIKATKVAAGGYHSIAIGYDATKAETDASAYYVYTWGSQESGRLGNNVNSTTPEGTPQNITSRFNFDAGDYPVDVGAGEHHSMLLTKNGYIYTWGDNTYGQLGTGDLTIRAVPYKITSLTGVSKISAGSVHSLALNSVKKLYSWGGNTNRQLGGSTDTALKRSTPTAVFTGNTFDEISAGELHNAGRLGTTLYTWGDRRGGKLGDGTTTNLDTDARETLYTVTGTYKAVSCGGGNTIAINSSSMLAVTGFGVNTYYGVTYNGSFVATTIQVNSISNGGMGMYISSANELFAIGYASRYDENWYGRTIQYDGSGKPITSPPEGTTLNITTGSAETLRRLTPQSNIFGIPTNYARATNSATNPTIDPTDNVTFTTTRVKINAFHTDFTDFAVAQITSDLYNNPGSTFSGASFKTISNKGVIINREGYYVVRYKKRSVTTYTKFIISNNTGPEVLVSSNNATKYFATINLYDGIGLKNVRVQGLAKIYNPATGTYTTESYDSGTQTVSGHEALFEIPKNSNTTFTVTASDINNVTSTTNVTINTSVAIINQNLSKQYDKAALTVSPTFHRPLDGVINLSTLTKYTYAAEVSYSSGSAPVNVGNYTSTITVKQNTAAIASKQINLTITSRPITITADAKTKVFGSADPALTYQITSGSLVSGDTLAGSLTRNAGNNVGTYPITQGTVNNNNYNITYVGANFTITPKNVAGNVTIAAIAAVYYETLPHTPTPAVTDTALGVQLVNNTDITYGYSGNTNAGTATVTVNGIGNYTGSTSTTFTINKSNVIIAANNIAKIYGDSLGNGDIIGTSKNANNQTANVAGSWNFVTAINPNPLCADSGSYNVKFTPSDLNNYNQPANIAITLTVSRKVLTISGVSGVNKVYDGNSVIQLSGGALQGIVYGDALSFTLGTANAPTPNAGAHTLINVNILVSGARIANYNFIQPTVTATITPKPLVGNVTIDAIPDYYYTSMEITPTPDVRDTAFGILLVNGTDIIYTYQNNIIASTAGNPAIAVINGINNYSGTMQVTFIIKKISVLITPDKIVLTYGDALGLANLTGQAKNANYPEVDVEGVWSFVSVYPTNPVCADSGFYVVRFAPADTFNYQDPDDVHVEIEIRQRDITITGVQAVNKIFNGNTEVNTVGGTGTLHNLVYSDVLTFELGIGHTPTPNVGTHTVGLNIQIYGDRAANYHLIQPTDVTVSITPKSVTGAVSIADIADRYYTTNAHTPTPAVTDNALSVALLNTVDFTYSYTNNVNAGTAATVTVTGKGNYMGTESKTFTILKSDIAILANNITKTYGQSLGAADITGTAKNANNSAVNVAGSFDFHSSFNPAPVCADSGSYSIKYIPADSANYNVSYYSITLTVNKKVITITGVYAENREYDGTKVVRLAGGTLQGLVYSDAITIIPGTANISIKDIGTYNVSNINVTLGGARAVNYTLTQPTGISVVISPKNLSAALDIGWSEVSVVYDGTYKTLASPPTVFDSVQTLVNNTDITYGAYSNNLFAGTAVIAIHGMGNYTGTNQITFEIEKRTVDIIYTNYSGLVYNGYEQTVNAYASNLVYNVVNAAQDVVNLTVEGNVNVNAGNYRITVTAVDNENYQIPVINYLDFTISRKDISLVKIAVMDEFVYNGSKIRRTPAVYDEQRANATLAQNIDFSFDYGGENDNINVVPGSTSEGFVTVVGIGNYTGLKTATFDIVPKTLVNAGFDATVSTAAIPSQTYTGFQITPAPAVFDLARVVTLVKDADYTCSYAANLNVVSGSLTEGTVVVTGKNNYTGSYSVSFDIAPKTIVLEGTPSIAVAEIAPMVYTGFKLTPTPAVTDIARGAAMVAGADFTYDYGASNQNIFATLSGTTEGRITLRGAGNYVGTVAVSFDIAPKTITASVTGLDISTNTIEMVYNGRYQSIVTAPVGSVQYDIDHASLPIFTVTYTNGRPYGVLADNATYPVKLTLDRTLFPCYRFDELNIAIRVLPKPIAVAFLNYENLVYDGTAKQISGVFADPSAICRNEQNVPDVLTLTLSQYTYVPFIGSAAVLDEVCNAGQYTVSASLSNTNYTFENSNVCTFTVAQKALTVRAEDKSKYFGDLDSAGTFTQRVASGTADGDINVLLQRDRSSANMFDYEQYGVYNYTGIAPQNNYSFSLAENSGYFFINKRMLNVVPQKHSKVYGESDPESFAQTVVSVFEIKIVFNFVRAAGEDVGVYAIDTIRTAVEYYLYAEGSGYVLDNSLAVNFRLSDFSAPDWFTIVKRPITVYMGEYTKTYGDPDPQNYTYQVDAMNLAESDRNKPLSEVFPNYTVTRVPGEDVKAGGYALTLELHNPNYDATMIGLPRLMITKLDIAAAYNLNEIFTVETSKVYDGNNKAAVTSELPELLKKTGFGVSATYTQRNAGEGITISLVYKINTTARGNFVLPADSTLTNGQITKRKLTVSFNRTSAEMVYGAALPEFSLTYNGYLYGDTAANLLHADLVTTGLVAPTINLGGLSEASVIGAYTLTLSNPGNYLNYYLDLSATATVTVLPAPLTLAAGEIYVRTEDGTRNAQLTDANFVFLGLKNNDTVPLTYNAVLDSGTPGNTYVRITNINCGNPNYTLLTSSLVLGAVISPLPVININEVTFDYDGKPKSVTPSITVGGNNMAEYTVTYSGKSYPETTLAPVNAGVYNVTVRTTSNEYRTVTAYSFLTIRRIVPQVTVLGTLTQTYGSFRPLTAKVKGIDFEQSIPVIYPFDLAQSPEVGTYTVSASFDGNTNYLPVPAAQTSVTLTIIPRAVSAAFIGYQDLVYDGTMKNVSAVFDGVLEGDTIQPVMTYEGALPINAGTYTVTVSSGNPNYKVVGSDTLTFIVAKRTLVVYVAGGTLNENGIPECDLVYEGFAEGENESALSVAPVVRLKTMTSGSNEVEISGGNARNYEIVFANDRNAEIEYEYTPHPQPSRGLYIILGAAGGLLMIVILAAIINRRKMIRG